ncbi:MAG: Fe-S cluster assembly protein SufD, partial [Spirochaetota bacterium]|nr:Fe-S cluster assembly protein SufD [Spirochaetota bacterium]
AITNNKIKNYLFETIRREEDVFAVINNSFMTNGLTIEIKPNNRLSKPLQILNVSIGSENKQLCLTPRIIIEFGTLSEGTVITKYIGNKGNYFVNAMHDFIIQEGAIVKNCNIQSDPYDTWHFLKTNITMLKDSKLHLTDVPHGNKLQRHNIKANLQAEGAELNINVASILNSNQQIHKCVRVHHEATHCSSKQIFKNIIKDHGHSSVDTTVIVHEGAQQTNSDQLINNLLLSDNAKADVKPNLMIYADDVKCTHGATTGQIDKDQIFYLKSRGLSDFEANKLLTSSFIKSIIDGIEYKPIVEELYQTLLKKLEE